MFLLAAFSFIVMRLALRWLGEYPFGFVGLIKLQPLGVEVGPEGCAAQGALEEVEVVAELSPHEEEERSACTLLQTISRRSADNLARLG